MRRVIEIDWWAFERQLGGGDGGVIAGVDEAGRGPLAGPVVAACVVLPFGAAAEALGLADSKALSAAQRERALAEIEKAAVAIGVGQAGPDEIDRVNILRATHLAMRRALCAALPACGEVDWVLVDGLPVPELAGRRGQRALVKGDSLSASIAAASIVAKVTRDRLMADFDHAFPGYGFARHKGYYCQEHLDALARLGPCPIHRKSFAPVRQLPLPF